MASPWLKLANRKAIVTGAGSGIGAAVTKALAAEGCELVLVDSDSDRLGLIGSDAKVATNCVQCDVSQESQVRSLFGNLETKPLPSILVNCAGITRDGWVADMNLRDHWDPVQDVNLKGTWLMCRAFVQQRQQLRHEEEADASIVNMSSIVALQGNLGQTNYAASKGGVIGLTKALAREVAQQRIRVNAIAPGFINTDMARAVPEKVLQGIKQKIPLGRLGEPEDVANLVLFLASERSCYISGETIKCSGMLSI